jgi:peptide/nickel transport system permease protein
VAAGRDGSGRTAEAGARLRSPALRLIGNRLATAIPVLWGVTFLTFAVIQLLPGDAAQQLLGINATPEQLQEFRDKLNLDDPSSSATSTGWAASSRATSALAGQRPAGDLDPQRRAADDLPAARLRALHLARPHRADRAPGARNPGGFVDRVGMVTSMAGLSVANYVLAVVLVYVFAVRLGWLPAIYTNDTGTPAS